MKILYTAEAVVDGGRRGHGRSTDDRLQVGLSVPKEMDGDGGPGTNPEQLFAVGYAACFQSAMLGVARNRKLDASGSTITARVGIGPTGTGGLALTAALDLHAPHLSRVDAEELMLRAHERCPYSRAIRGNVAVELTVDGTPLELRSPKIPEAEPGLPTRILVGLDGSVGSAYALDWAIQLATALDAEILATHVFQLTSAAVANGLAPIMVPDQWLADLRRELEDEWAAPLKQARVRYRTIFEAGIPAPTLIDIAARERADLIVAGSRGLGGIGELLLGSVSHQLVLHAPVPVVVIPAEHRNDTVAAKTVQEPATLPVSAVAAPS